MSLTYPTYLSELLTLIPTTADDASFQAILPGAIDYAEQRLYRELDLLSTVITDATGITTANSRSFTLPQSIGRFVAVKSIDIVTPAGKTGATGGVRIPLVRTSLECLGFLWPTDTALSPSSVPSQWAPVTDQLLLFAPSPGAAFFVEITGTIRPISISASYPSTFLSLYLPDLFVAASMVFISGYMKNWGAQSDDPKMAISWEAQYERLFASANAEELRRKFGAVPQK